MVAKELPIAIQDVDIKEAVTDLLPLVLDVAYDEDDTVRETFINELDKIIMYFYLVSSKLYIYIFILHTRLTMSSIFSYRMHHRR
jgi:hypothetical protein